MAKKIDEEILKLLQELYIEPINNSNGRSSENKKGFNTLTKEILIECIEDWSCNCQ